MPEEERLRLVAIRDRIALVKSWIGDMDEQGFVSNLMARDAVALSLLVIGETARPSAGNDEEACTGSPVARHRLAAQQSRA